jgi:hypothetical protein
VVADELQVQGQGPGGGNGFSVDLKQRSLGITGPIVIPVLALLLVGAIGWIRSRDLKDSLDATNVHLQQLYVRQETYQQALHTLVLAQVEQLRALHLSHKDLLKEQHKEWLELLRENRDVTGAKLDQQNTLLAEQTLEMRKQHAIIIWNQRHEPGEHLSLDLPFPPERLDRPDRPERQR